MKNILYSCFGQTDSMYRDYLQMFLDEVQNYKTSFKIKDIFSDKELEYVGFFVRSYDVAAEMPSQTLFCQNYPETQGSFGTCIYVKLTDLRVYLFNLIDARINSYTSRCITQLNAEVKKRGITEEIRTELDRLDSISNRNKAKEISTHVNAEEEYKRMLLRPGGLVTGIQAVDEKIGGMDPGTVTTIAGFTSQFKTTWALNIAYHNTYNLGYNIAYLSLEMPKQDMKWNLVSRHSYSSQFSKFPFVAHDKMRHAQLTQDEYDYAFHVVEDDLDNSKVPGASGQPVSRGRIAFLDESDFRTFSFGEITAALEKVDDELIKEGRQGLDAVIVDYVQLCKFSGVAGVTMDANGQINSYVTFFRRLGQSFRKVVDPNTGKEVTKQLVIILLAQLNRTGWLKASRNNGRYDMTALADANELERGSSRVFTTFTTEDMKARNSAQVQILKNRAGQTMTDPATVFVEPQAYVFCDETAGQAGFSSGMGVQASSLDAAFGGMDDLGSLGL